MWTQLFTICIIPAIPCCLLNSNHTTLEAARQHEGAATFFNAPFPTPPHQAAGLPASSRYQHSYKGTTSNAAGASGKLLHPAPTSRAFLWKRRIRECWSPKPVPNQSPSCSCTWANPAPLEALVACGSVAHPARSPWSCADRELTGHVWRHRVWRYHGKWFIDVYREWIDQRQPDDRRSISHQIKDGNRPRKPFPAHISPTKDYCKIMWGFFFFFFFTVCFSVWLFKKILLKFNKS